LGQHHCPWGASSDTDETRQSEKCSTNHDRSSSRVQLGMRTGTQPEHPRSRPEPLSVWAETIPAPRTCRPLLMPGRRRPMEPHRDVLACSGRARLYQGKSQTKGLSQPRRPPTRQGNDDPRSCSRTAKPTTTGRSRGGIAPAAEGVDCCPEYRPNTDPSGQRTVRVRRSATLADPTWRWVGMPNGTPW
jgi:hypothetical protein